MFTAPTSLGLFGGYYGHSHKTLLARSSAQPYSNRYNNTFLARKCYETVGSLELAQRYEAVQYEIGDVVDTAGVRWSNIDVLRMGFVETCEERSRMPVKLSIGAWEGGSGREGVWRS
jgi:hypothetical protein